MLLSSMGEDRDLSSRRGGVRVPLGAPPLTNFGSGVAGWRRLLVRQEEAGSSPVRVATLMSHAPVKTLLEVAHGGVLIFQERLGPNRC